MASLWKHPESKYWTACFTAKDGRQLKRSTKETNRTKALKIAHEYETAARKARTAKQVRTVIHDLHQEITGEEIKTISVREFLNQWIIDKNTSTGPATRLRYKAAIDAFLEFLSFKAEDEIISVNRQDIRGFHNAEALRVAASTANGELKCLRMAFHTARRDGLITENPCEFIKGAKPNEPPMSRRPFTSDEIKLVLSVADEEWLSMTLFGLYTGQRLADIACLRWSNVNLSEKRIRLITRKNGKKMCIPIAPPLQKHLRSISQLDNGDTPIHPNAFEIVRKQNGKVGTLSNQFASILARAGLREKVSHRSEGNGRDVKRASSPLSFHCLRHTAVTLLKEANVPMAVVMELIGHDSKAMSEHYTHVGEAALAQAADKIPSFV